ncbi:MAG: VapC toxin family PIN domain ribonuclease [Methylocystaceae bacterium]|nr:MAG: VapC toxin family PIN domain ribonuclease [Methylocystaceae bacterium]
MTSRLVYLDTNVFIAGFESPASNAEPVQDLLLALREKPGFAVTSELTLAELLAPISRPHVLAPAERRRLYLDLLVGGGMIDLRPVTREILIETADLRRTTRQKLPDAIHVATALHADCRFFMSHDDGMRKLPEGLTRLHPDRAGAASIIEALRG